jgi:hypothetical protein
MNNLLCCVIVGKESRSVNARFYFGETSCIELTFYLVAMRDSKTHLPWRLDGTTKEKRRIHHSGACHTHIFHMISPTWKGSNLSGSCLQVLLITLEERKAFDRNGFNKGEHMGVRITGGLLWYNLLRSRCGVWCAGYVINGVRLAHDIMSSMWDLLVFRTLSYIFTYQKKRRKIVDVMAVNCFT